MIEPKKECCPLTIEAVINSQEFQDALAGAGGFDTSNEADITALKEAIAECLENDADGSNVFREAVAASIADDPEAINSIIDKVSPKIEQLGLGNVTLDTAGEQELANFSYTPKFPKSVIQVTVHYNGTVSEDAPSGVMGAIFRLRRDSATGGSLDTVTHGSEASATTDTVPGTLTATVAATGSAIDYFITGILGSGATDAGMRDIDVVIIETPVI